MAFVKSVLAGIVIGLGAVANLSVDNKYLGALLFSIGLLAVLHMDLYLYTGKACNRKYVYKYGFLLLIFIGNLIGCLTMAMFTIGKADLVEKARAIVELKASKDLWRFCFDAILCEFCIAIAVKCKNDFVTIIGIMVFILIGGEHVVADAFYFVLGGCGFWMAVKLLGLAFIFNHVGGAIFSLLDINFDEIVKNKEPIEKKESS